MKRERAAALILAGLALCAIWLGTAAWMAKNKQYTNLLFTTGSVDMQFSLEEGTDFDQDGVLDLYPHDPGSVEENTPAERVTYVSTAASDGTDTRYCNRYVHLYEVSTKQASGAVAIPELTISKFTPGQEYVYRLKSLSQGTVHSTVTVDVDKTGVTESKNFDVISIQAFLETTDFTTGEVTVTPAAEGKQFLVNELPAAGTVICLAQNIEFQKNELANESSVVILLKVRFNTLPELQEAAPRTFGGLSNLNDYEGANFTLPDLTVTVASN